MSSSVLCSSVSINGRKRTSIFDGLIEGLLRQTSGKLQKSGFICGRIIFASPCQDHHPLLGFNCHEDSSTIMLLGGLNGNIFPRVRKRRRNLIEAGGISQKGVDDGFARCLV